MKITKRKIIPASVAGTFAAVAVGTAAFGWSAPQPAVPASSAALAASVHHGHAGPSHAVATWYYSGGKQRLNAVGTALANISTDSNAFASDLSSGASTTNDLSNLSSDAGTLDGSAGSLLKDLPPGASRSDVASACHSLQQAAFSYEAGIFLFDEGNTSGAATQFNYAQTYLNQADTDVSNATTIISNGG